MPLAIELAAARVGSLSVEQIAGHLDDRFRLLSDGNRTALRRQQTLLATIDWSYDLLSESEKVLLRRLSVFAGGWTLEAAEEVCAGGSESPAPKIQRADVLGLLLRLVDRSLVVAEEVTGEERYRLLETIRQYVQEKLFASGETGLVRDRHRHWCLVFARQSEPRLVGPDSSLWLERLEAEHDNLRAALAWCLEHDVESGLKLVGIVRQFLYLRGYYGEGRAWATDLLARSPAESIARVRALNTSALMARGQGDGVASQRLFDESLSLARKLGDRRGLGFSALHLAMGFTFEGDSDAAAPLVEDALAIGRELGETWIVVTALRVLGNLAASWGELGQARRLLEESLTLARASGDQQSIAFGLLDLGRVWLVGGEPSRARALIDESLMMFIEVDYAFGVGLTRLNLAYVAIAEGDVRSAKALLVENVEATRRTDVRMSLWGPSLRLAGLVAVASRDFVRGVRLFGAFETERRRILVDWDTSLRRVWDETLANARSALGEKAFARALSEGQAMTLEEAVEVALQESDDTELTQVPIARAIAPSAQVSPSATQPRNLHHLTEREVEVLRSQLSAARTGDRLRAGT